MGLPEDDEEAWEDFYAEFVEPDTSPNGANAPFAPLLAGSGHWPIITSDPQGRMVSYRTISGNWVGSAGRSFGASRSGGSRYHVGVDLFGRFGDPVVAIADGRIVRFYPFCCGSNKTSWALLVQHDNLVVNYGEVAPDSLRRNNLAVGSNVRAGQVIGRVGRNPGGSSMIHFETYTTGTTANGRWLRGHTRPTRLLNPTRLLLQLQEQGLPRPATGESEVKWKADEAFEFVTDFVEVATDPAVPVHPRITIRGSVGRRGTNNAADVTAIQTRLRDLRYLSAADFAAEAVAAGTTAVADASIRRTIVAIETFQREVVALRRPDAQVGTRGNTLRDLNRAIPRPTAAEYTAITRQRNTITETVTRGVTITGPVGRTTAGNAAADVTAVQNRLVQLGYLRSTHGEAPTGTAVTSAAIRRTIAAIRQFQRKRVNFWRRRGTVAGAVTDRVVAPGDATQALLDRISTWDETFPGGAGTVRLSDHVASRHTRSTTGVKLSGTASPTAIPAADYVTMGLTAGDAASLAFVSRHEGKFDALNTYDRARVSVGFIQFAGARGLPKYLALLKSRNAAVFRTRLGQYGIEVEFNVDAGGDIKDARVVVLDPGTSAVLRGVPAEEAIRNNKRLSAVFVMSGRNHDVQVVQIEAAIRDYVIPAKNYRASWGAPAVRAKLGDIIRSQRGRAMLFDRAIQQGTGGGPVQFRAAIRFVHTRTPLADLAAAQTHEADILAQVEANLLAGSNIATALQSAITEVDTMRRATRASGATVAGVTATAGTARTQLDTAIAAVPRLSPGSTFNHLNANLRALRIRLDFATPPVTVAALRTDLDNIKAGIDTERKRVANSGGFHHRIHNIRVSALTGP